MKTVVAVAIFGIATVSFACGPGDFCSSDSDCEYSGSPCPYCNTTGNYCVSEPPAPPPSPGPVPPPPSDRVQWEQFLLANVDKQSGMPLSYMVYPSDYFDNVPESQKSHSFTEPSYQAACGGNVTPDRMNNYTFQTETMLTTAGTNIYDAAVWSIALCRAGHCDTAKAYYRSVISTAHTVQLQDIRGDKACGGVMAWGECSDPQQSGKCGFCYGDTANKTPAKENAWFFRMISDWYAFADTVDLRCPEKRLEWVWNDWKPIAGENAWAQLTGIVQVLSLENGGIDRIPPRDPLMQVAADFVSWLPNMLTPAGAIPGHADARGVYFCPRNMFYSLNRDAGSSVSVENNASLLAGLRLFLRAISAAGSPYAHLVTTTKSLIQAIEAFLLAAYTTHDIPAAAAAGQGRASVGASASPSFVPPPAGTYHFFSQGGSIDHATGKWLWAQGTDIPTFAVDCQTWVALVLGADTIDGKYGGGTALKVWETTKQLAGYGMQADGKVKGVGYTVQDSSSPVFSGEWTMGAVTMLRVLANSSSYTVQTRDMILAEADFMAAAVAKELRLDVPKASGGTVPSVRYSSQRYWIPFGWYANPLPATSSTSWMLLDDLKYNPLGADGAY
eukprot:TRINITY_DN1239_c0_g1_i1.p1 TRINITY_DN1239_c0_g1~~TRINITY_DN1239_c0_g1_i1.p1  ORF type:complete len:615 (+),score=143.75 TRINITY_DN1239_c0_g1_i1:105-1949(+)